MNKDAKYYTPVGSYHGALKFKGKWVRVKNLNYLDKSKLTRWTGPPSPAIIKALDCKKIKFDFGKYWETYCEQVDAWLGE